MALADWRGVALGWRMVGFGLGGAIGTALGMPSLAFYWEQPPLWLMLYVLVQAMVGIFGGASWSGPRILEGASLYKGEAESDEADFALSGWVDSRP